MKHRALFLLGTLALLGCATSQKAIEVPIILKNGAVRVVLNGCQRQTLATLSDVDHLQLNLDVSKEGDDRSALMPKAMLTNGGASASITFSDLWPGEATLSVEAFDADNSSLGTASATASIKSDRIITVPFTLQLHAPLG